MSDTNTTNGVQSLIVTRNNANVLFEAKETKRKGKDSVPKIFMEPVYPKTEEEKSNYLQHLNELVVDLCYTRHRQVAFAMTKSCTKDFSEPLNEELFKKAMVEFTARVETIKSMQADLDKYQKELIFDVISNASLSDDVRKAKITELGEKMKYLSEQIAWRKADNAEADEEAEEAAA